MVELDRVEDVEDSMLTAVEEEREGDEGKLGGRGFKLQNAQKDITYSVVVVVTGPGKLSLRVYISVAKLVIRMILY